MKTVCYKPNMYLNAVDTKMLNFFLQALMRFDWVY